MTPFSVIVFVVVVWTIAVPGAKQLRFRLKTDQCGRGLTLTTPANEREPWVTRPAHLKLGLVFVNAGNLQGFHFE